MRFAWLREQAGNDDAVEQSPTNRLIFVIYNAVWWVPIVFVILGLFDPRTGLITFAVITAVRAVANLYRNNVLPVEQGEVFPFRAP